MLRTNMFLIALVAILVAIAATYATITHNTVQKVRPEAPMFRCVIMKYSQICINRDSIDSFVTELKTDGQVAVVVFSKGKALYLVFESESSYRNFMESIGTYLVVNGLGTTREGFDD